MDEVGAELFRQLPIEPRVAATNDTSHRDHLKGSQGLLHAPHVMSLSIAHVKVTASGTFEPVSSDRNGTRAELTQVPSKSFGKNAENP